MLWKKKELTPKDIAGENFESVKSLGDEELPHVGHAITKCKECGQLYLREYNDFFASPYADDLPVYITLVPVSEEELRVFLGMEKDLLSIYSTKSPTIRYDIKTEGEKIYWADRDAAESEDR